MGRHSWALAGAVLIGSLGHGSSAMAQALERNLPPVEMPKPAIIETPEAPPATNDDQPLGAALTRLVILGPTTGVSDQPEPPGVEIDGVARLDQPASRTILARFLGQPVSKKLIAGIQTTIVQDYRRMGYPFVEVSMPAQEIGKGVLQVRVVEFHVGGIAVAGMSPGDATHIRRRIRLAPDDAIETSRLIEDLDWLGRYPFRTITPAFTPGTALGQTDLDLAVTRTKPWQLIAGYANSGSALTGWDRFYVGAIVGIRPLNDALLAAQVTGSRDFWVDHGGPFSQAHPRYESAAARLVLPTAPRQDIELTVDAVESNEVIAPFLIRQKTLEAALGYRFALSNLIALPGEVALGVEAARQTRSFFFGPYKLLSGAVNIYQLFGEWSDSWSDRLGHSSLDLKLHGSPGGIDAGNSTTAFVNYTSGRVTSSAYVYAELRFDRWTKLPHGFGLATQVIGQYAGRAIPDPEQIAIGGQAVVRGYSLDDGAFDDAIVLRNEIHAPSITIIGKGALITKLAPLAFVDLGYGRDEAAIRSQRIGSVGIGTDAQFSRHLTGSFSVSYPLASARYTRHGDWHLDARASVRF